MEQIGSHASIHLSVPEGLSELIQESLSPEVEHSISERSNVIITSKKCDVSIFIEALDIVALRAAINSYLRWINTILDIVKTVG
jgi:KEOPS complex subunit Pcc1